MPINWLRTTLASLTTSDVTIWSLHPQEMSQTTFLYKSYDLGSISNIVGFDVEVLKTIYPSVKWTFGGEHHLYIGYIDILIFK